MRIVIALGGNALLKRGEPLNIKVQRENARTACQAIVPLLDKHSIVLTHGNGPQVGLLALQGGALSDIEPYPLDVLGAQSEGMIGYLLEQELINAMPSCKIANLMTETIVDGNDPAFSNPTKFIGPVYDEETAHKLARKHGWTVKPDGAYFRRVVPSPLPEEILAAPAIKTLSDAGYVVVCTGGGGVPVIRQEMGMLEGTEAVIDKDLASSLLAIWLNADALLMLTDVDAVYENWGTKDQKAIRHATVHDMKDTEFAAGSMGPKVTAACEFVQRTGNFAGIGSLEEAVDILAGKAGTMVQPNGERKTANA